MIIVRTPVRISIGGGGTDLPHYYEKKGGFLVTAAINKYIYILLHDRKFYNTHLIRYSEIENVANLEEIKHTRVREALKFLNIQEHLEITSIADTPSGTGLGSSGSFLVGVLNALHAHKKEFVSASKLAEEACTIDLDILKEPVGKQDQYIAAHGGILQMDINKQGKVMASRLNLHQDTIKELEKNLFFFYTGVRRSASKILQDQKNNSVKMDYMDGMNQIKEIGRSIKKALENGNTKRFGEWLNVHWETKKTFSTKMTNPEIDEMYNYAIRNGAIGGKIMGAGGGGFFMFYCDKNQDKFRNAMLSKGMKELDVKFDHDGSKILLNN